MLVGYVRFGYHAALSDWQNLIRKALSALLASNSRVLPRKMLLKQRSISRLRTMYGGRAPTHLIIKS